MTRWHCLTCGRRATAPTCQTCDGTDRTPWQWRQGFWQDCICWLLAPAFAWSDWRQARRRRKL